MTQNIQTSDHYEYIDTQSGLKRLVKKLQSARRIALDIEANSLYHYYEKVCLIQISAGKANFIVDPLAGCDLTDLLDLISRKDLIFHCGDYDLRMLKQSYGFHARGRIFDTMLAAKLLGYKRFSLLDLIEHFTGIRVSKSSQKSNWTKRPLTEKQLLYASNDTRYLELIADQLEIQLREKDRLHWHDQTVERLLTVIEDIGPPINCNRIWRIKGARELDRHQMAILRELWWWRETEAGMTDRPPFKIMSNDKMIGIVRALRHQKADPDKLATLIKIPKNFLPDRVARLHNALLRALGMPSEQWPDRIPGDYRPDYPTELFELLRRETAHQARPYDIDPSIIAPRAVLGRIAGACPDNLESMHECAPTLLPWQSRILYEAFMRVIRDFNENK